VLARELQKRGVARGLVLCIGASINYLTGAERRAPRWMQQAGAEWAYRLLQNPGRLAHRYLIRGPRIFLLLRRIRIQLKTPLASLPSEDPSSSPLQTASQAEGDTIVAT
jgi:UDP-N-acetyl-D-mannosaminuronic acid transferase (WecB/TagA/CpsF family)